MRTRLGTILVVALLLAAALFVANTPIDAGLVAPSAVPGQTSSAANR